MNINLTFSIKSDQLYQWFSTVFVLPMDAFDSYSHLMFKKPYCIFIIKHSKELYNKLLK